MSFSNFPLRPEILQAVEAMEFHEPTPIQQQAIPIALEGRDILASAQTGTGKTLAFLLPLLHKILTRGQAGLGGLVLLPTRELAAQVEAVAQSCHKFCHVRCALVVGGASHHEQIKRIRAGAQILIATPGRLLDHLQQGTVRLNQVHSLVLDEADRMLDMGFAPALHAILRYLPAERQTMLFSATLPPDVQRFINLALKNPQRIAIGQDSKPAATISQFVYPVSRHQKNDLLLAMLNGAKMTQALIFCRTKRGSDRLAHFLKANDLSVDTMHADKTQSQRNAALHNFKNGKVQILVATDIAARGLDVKLLSHVINFDVPQHTEDYIHRIGRTGRMEATGEAFTLVTLDEEPYITAIERFMNATIPRAMVPDFPYSSPPLMVKPQRPQQPRFMSGGRRISPLRARRW